MFPKFSRLSRFKASVLRVSNVTVEKDRKKRCFGDFRLTWTLSSSGRVYDWVEWCVLIHIEIVRREGKREHYFFWKNSLPFLTKLRVSFLTLQAPMNTKQLFGEFYLESAILMLEWHPVTSRICAGAYQCLSHSIFVSVVESKGENHFYDFPFFFLVIAIRMRLTLSPLSISIHQQHVFRQI